MRFKESADAIAKSEPIVLSMTPCSFDSAVAGRPIIVNSRRPILTTAHP